MRTSSVFAIPERKAWPISDRKHAQIALVYMLRGFGDRAEYARILKAIAHRYPPEDSRNRAIWETAKKLRTSRFF